MKALLISVVVLFLAACGSEESQPDLHGQAAKDFIRVNPQLGSLSFPYVEEVADWAKGKRRVVTTDLGGFLMYLEGQEVVTVYYMDDALDGGKVEIWRKPDEIKEEIAHESKDYPSYIVQDGQIFDTPDGRYADVVIQTLDKDIAENDLKAIAVHIKTEQSLDYFRLFNSSDAVKARYSDSFARSNPGAVRGLIAEIRKDGSFYMHSEADWAEHIEYVNM